MLQHPQGQEHLGPIGRSVGTKLARQLGFHQVARHHCHDRVEPGDCWSDIRERRGIVTQKLGGQGLIATELYQDIFQHNRQFFAGHRLVRLEQIRLGRLVKARLQATHLPLHECQYCRLERMLGDIGRRKRGLAPIDLSLHRNATGKQAFNFQFVHQQHGQVAAAHLHLGGNFAAHIADSNTRSGAGDFIGLTPSRVGRLMPAPLTLGVEHLAEQVTGAAHVMRAPKGGQAHEVDCGFAPPVVRQGVLINAQLLAVLKVLLGLRQPVFALQVGEHPNGGGVVDEAHLRRGATLLGLRQRFHSPPGIGLPIGGIGMTGRPLGVQQGTGSVGRGIGLIAYQCPFQPSLRSVQLARFERFHGPDKMLCRIITWSGTAGHFWRSCRARAQHDQPQHDSAVQRMSLHTFLLSQSSALPEAYQANIILANEEGVPCAIAQTTVNPFGETPDWEDHRMNRRTPTFPAPADRTLNRRTRCPHSRLRLIVLAWLALTTWTAQTGHTAEDQELDKIRRAAEQGDAEAQTDLGGMYRDGQGLPQDDAQAVHWYRRAADQGYAPAQDNLGRMYQNGRGVPQDDAQAVSWYRRAADQDEANAQNNLGAMYQMGRGVLRDYTQAVHWYRRAADQGYAPAQDNLGRMYQNGRGVPQDDAQAVSWYRRAADQGHARAQANLGWMYANGRGVPQDDTQAVSWYRRAADQGHARAQRHLGWMYANGRGVPQDDTQAVSWYRRAVDQGHARAQRHLGWMYEMGRGVPQDYTQAVHWYRRAADQGYARAQDNLGRMYQNGRGVPQDDAQAVSWYRRAADQGYARAQANLGWMYANGRGVPQDDTQAVSWYRRAVDQGHARAQRHLGWMYEMGRGVPQDDAEAVRWYRRAADQDEATAQTNLGLMYVWGRGVLQDDTQAVRWFRRAVDQGDARAQGSLGEMYSEGRGVLQDDTQAVRWFRRAADQGDAIAQGNLGWMYSEGRGVPQDDTQAVHWYRRAADQGHGIAQNNLGWMYQEGRGVRKDIVAAYMWFNLAVASGYQDAAEQRTSLARSMTKAQLAEAQRRTREWTGVEDDPELARLEAQVQARKRQRQQQAAREKKRQELRAELARLDKEEQQVAATRPTPQEASPPVQDDLPRLLDRAGSVRSNPQLHALVIGISDYAEAADVPYAARSAQTFARVLRKALGAQAENIALLTNAEATSGRLRGRLRATLARLGPHDRLVMYYAGHGVPDRADSYLLAQDAVPGSYMEPDLRLSALYEQIAASSVEHALVFIDACFSGRANRDTMIFPGIAPARLQPRPGAVVSERISVLSAGGSEEFANQDQTRGHRLFGYHLMRALLDQGGRRLTMATLHDQVREEVLRASLRLGPEFRQEPELHGNTSVRVY